MIFARANEGDAASIKSILHTYEHLSGQKINLEKSEISFSKGLGSNIRGNIRTLLGMEEVLTHDKYLGLPTIFDRSKKISFTGIRDRIWKKPPRMEGKTVISGREGGAYQVHHPLHPKLCHELL